jgi:hypothetical protein
MKKESRICGIHFEDLTTAEDSFITHTLLKEYIKKNATKRKLAIL